MPYFTSPAPRDGVKMTYTIGQTVFEFSPVPFIQCDTAFDLSGKKETGQTITINVSGTLVASKHLENEGIRDENAQNLQYNIGLQGMSPLERQRRKMEQVLSVPGGEFKIYCICGDAGDGCEDIVYFRIFPQMIGNISFQNSPDNWTQTIPYTFQIVVHRTDIFNKNGKPIYLESIDENWSMELVDEKIYPRYNDIDFQERNANSLVVMRLTHTLNATGKKVYGEQGFNETRGNDQLVHEWRRDHTEASIDDYDSGHPEEKYVPVNTDSDNIRTPYQYAKEWIETRLYSLNRVEESIRETSVHPWEKKPREEFFYISEDGIFNWNRYKSVFNHTRQKTGNEVAGTYSVTESWIIIVGDTETDLPRDDNGNIIGATEEYTLNYQHNNSNGIDTVTIEGTITGYQEGNIDQPSARSKIYQAGQLFKRLAEGNYFHRRCDYYMRDIITHSRACDVLAAENHNGIPELANLEYKKDEVIRSLNIIPISKSIRKQIVEGIITYSYEFNTKCPNLFADTLMESITTSITYPTDVFTTVIIPGRQQGPLFFSANTQQAPKYTLNVELVLKPECPPGSPLVMPLGDPTRYNPEIYTRVRARLVTKHNCRERMIMIARAHYDYIKGVMGDIIKIEADTDNWNESEGRYSGNITFVFGRCQSKYEGDYLLSLTKLFGNANSLQSAL